MFAKMFFCVCAYRTWIQAVITISHSAPCVSSSWQLSAHCSRSRLLVIFTLSPAHCRLTFHWQMSQNW